MADGDHESEGADGDGDGEQRERGDKVAEQDPGEIEGGGDRGQDRDLPRGERAEDLVGSVHVGRDTNRASHRRSPESGGDGGVTAGGGSCGSGAVGGRFGARRRGGAGEGGGGVGVGIGAARGAAAGVAARRGRLAGSDAAGVAGDRRVRGWRPRVSVAAVRAGAGSGVWAGVVGAAGMSRASWRGRAERGAGGRGAGVVPGGGVLGRRGCRVGWRVSSIGSGYCPERKGRVPW